MSRPTSSQRGYGARWRRRRRRFLRDNPTCDICHRRADTADHYPVSRRELIARGEPDPDQARFLRALCTGCHNTETAKHQPGGFAHRARRKRKAERHPGIR